ncbi:MAG: sigma-70 family RNA polymerase sigma factor [Flavobacteriaceae bacterium]|nr:sigma-70 family RNA polymerase sigma factor [Flavobacteriaceae bacterium]
MSESNSNTYIEALCDGNERVILEIYKNYFSKTASFITKNNGTYEDAQEIFQLVLYQLTARAKVKKFEVKSSFEAYLFTACKNLWRRELNKRKKQVRNDGVLELLSEEEENGRSILEQERWELFEEKIAELSENCMKLLGAYFKKVSYKEIVQQFGYASENAAFQRVFKCKKRLTDLIKKDNRFKELCF